jgi:hypothetical protein
MTRLSTIALTTVGALMATFVGWRVHASRTRPIAHFDIVKDPSRSVTDGCETLAGLAESIFASGGISAKSTLNVLVVGDVATANEPKLLASYLIPFSTKVVEGRNANRHRQTYLIKDLVARCQAMPRTDTSPIFLTVKQAIADLRGRGCNAASHCELFVDSDLEENVELGIKSRLNAIDSKKPLPATLDNSGIAISFCGLAATSGRIARDPHREDRLKVTWRSLFLAQDLVSFKPYCPTSSTSANEDVHAPAAPSPLTSIK